MHFSFRSVVSSFFLLLLVSCAEDAHFIQLEEDELSEDLPLCFFASGDSTFEIGTWNIRRFGASTNTEVLQKIIRAYPLDLIAVQEITDPELFISFYSSIPGWQGITSSSGDLRLGYLYRSAEVSLLDNSLEEWFVDDSYLFPRPPLKIEIENRSGQNLTVVNLHLKCCDSGNGPVRRKQASEKLKSWLSMHYAESNIVVAGDWNENINYTSEGAFSNFISDSLSYRFADQAISESQPDQWSYPSYPSDLDHILISDELFANLQSAHTMRPDTCVSFYFREVSDHLPVMAVFRWP